MAVNDAPMKPLVFGTRSILAWQQFAKTQTRRLVRPQPEQKWWKPWQSYEGHWRWYNASGFVGDRLMRMRQPYAVGDICWIREGLVRIGSREALGDMGVVSYAVDGVLLTGLNDGFLVWRWERDKLPAMFMPKYACRYYAKVVSVRPERLLDITDEDAVAEGVLVGSEPMTRYHGQYHGWYISWWDSLHKKPGTRSEDNPWVWVYGLEAVDASTEA